MQRQADELAPDSSALLDRIGLHPGYRAIDVGCGPRGIIDLLAARVLPGGQVVGLDGDPAHVTMASELVASQGWDDVEIVRADARHTGLESDSFDLVHARTLLVTLPEPAEVLTEMVRLARMGGWVAGMEPDTEAAICYPPSPAFDRLCEIFTRAFSRNGADPHLGRRMAELYRQAGLEDVTIEARSEIHGRNPFTKGEKPAFHTPLDNFVKLRLWQLPYERVVFLDADTMVVRNIDRLFDYPEFSAAPNVYERVGDFRRLNSGVFAARPSADDLRARCSRGSTAPGAFWKRTDQTFLEAFFPDWQGLPVYDNLLQYVWLNLPELWDWGLVRVVHYQYEKPWDPANAKAESLRPLVELWQAFHDGATIPDLATLPLPG